MFAVSLALMLAGVPGPAPTVHKADYSGRFGCHPYASNKVSCVSRTSATRGGDTSPRCHPDPTKTRLCEAQVRKSTRDTQLARAEKDGAVSEQ